MGGLVYQNRSEHCIVIVQELADHVTNGRDDPDLNLLDLDAFECHATFLRLDFLRLECLTSLVVITLRLLR